MNRRKFLKRTILGSTAISFGGIYYWLNSGQGVGQLNLDSELNKLERLETVKLTSHGLWNVAQILNHLAQSVEYSIKGYPHHKSKLFKNTIGKVAFSTFSKKGQMYHNLSEEIPGAPQLIDNDPQQALDRLKQSLIDFKNFKGPLKPHFAYGKLNKQEYTFAHLMHINNHFEEMTIDV